MRPINLRSSGPPHKGSNKPLRGSGPRSRFWSRATGIRATAFIAILIALPALTVTIVPLTPEAQEAGKVARIGWLSLGSPGGPFMESFRPERANPGKQEPDQAPPGLESAAVSSSGWGSEGVL